MKRFIVMLLALCAGAACSDSLSPEEQEISRECGLVADVLDTDRASYTRGSTADSGVQISLHVEDGRVTCVMGEGRLWVSTAEDFSPVPGGSISAGFWRQDDVR